MSDSNLFTLMFGSFANGVITIGLLLLITILLIKVKRILIFAEILALIFVYGAYIELLVPFLMEVACGDPLAICLLLINTVQVASIDPLMGLALYVQTIKPLAGLEIYFHVTLHLIGLFLIGTFIIRLTAKLIKRKDQALKN